jgi:adenine C2-methylase RlmN of 23S rRNA A2503 and tRNA A37
VTQLRVLKSNLDASVNFISEADKGFYESRYVRRGDYFIAYLSAQSACNRGCGFCHLTTTGQTVGKDATSHQILEQAGLVLEHYKKLVAQGEPPAPYLHFNFMARGEPLSNMHVNDYMITELGKLAAERVSLPSKTNISTIMPKTMKVSLAERFMYSKPTIYYSLYSTKDAFRDKWLPGAMPHEQALEQLGDYHERTGASVKIHFAFIEGENDNWYEMVSISNALKKIVRRIPGLSVNIVRYNPPDENSREPPEKVIYKNMSVLKETLPVKIIDRVGLDIYASCGTFFSGKD